MNALKELKRVERFNSELHGLLNESYLSGLQFGEEIRATVYYPTSDKVRYAPLFVNGRRVILEKGHLYDWTVDWYRTYLLGR